MTEKKWKTFEEILNENPEPEVVDKDVIYIVPLEDGQLKHFKNIESAKEIAKNENYIIEVVKNKVEFEQYLDAYKAHLDHVNRIWFTQLREEFISDEYDDYEDSYSNVAIAELYQTLEDIHDHFDADYDPDLIVEHMRLLLPILNAQSEFVLESLGRKRHAFYFHGRKF